jgi:predicted NBD/HSP70 family sugar kinase
VRSPETPKNLFIGLLTEKIGLRTVAGMPQLNDVRAPTSHLHAERALRLLRERGALSRSELADALGISRTTVSGVTAALLAQGAIVVTETDADEREGSGRPAERLALDPGAGQFIALEFSHARIFALIADASHEIIGSGRRDYDSDATWDDRLRLAFELVDQLVDSGPGVHLAALQAVAIGIPGPVSALGLHMNGVRHSETTVRAVFEKKFGVPVIVDNNTRFAAIVEANSSTGAGRDIIYARLADGVGGGVIVAGRLVTGSTGLAGEIGHIRAVDEGGALCRCGKRGCVETVASSRAIIDACAARGSLVASLDDIGTALQQGDPIVESALDEAGTALGIALAGCAVVLNPEEIIIGGEIVRIAPRLLDAVSAALRNELIPIIESTPSVVAARGGDETGAMGGIIALLHRSPLLAGYQEPTVVSRSLFRREAS